MQIKLKKITECYEDKLIHLVSPSGYDITLCSIASDYGDAEKDEVRLFTSINSNTITCPECIQLLKKLKQLI